MSRWKANREMMRSHFGVESGEVSDQNIGVDQPPLEKPDEPGMEETVLPDPVTAGLQKNGIRECILERKSRRKFFDDPLNLEELSFLLWSTQGVKKVVPAYTKTGRATLRTVPSAGARHPFETYLAVNRVEGLEPGIYRYSPLRHSLLYSGSVDGLGIRLTEASAGQGFVGAAPVVFIWSCRPYLGEWRYMGESHKVMLIDAGHVCQNLYLAAEALGLGTVAIGAYSQELMDDLLQLDGEDEFVVYCAPVGRVES
ncbi:MAG TPA: SagB/ThcOx family dehydrogenase [Candidatus Sabulitectum sp.]|nr:SagB/ThcOx family dehydrogenase [Candidatus Sabulitectum sp.]HPF32843.1 SagB/ThcOx family dehydrogenase [Candidatus Sabulitectum sp.]HPJ27895.1 SagB/ThcOx family dehydrogenase [Candidatus Sabulitectum sp.]HPR21876.1 SagB/ThcOx family dehydrogenase [Candidatus Sabulitectum sp.]